MKEQLESLLGQEVALNLRISGVISLQIKGALERTTKDLSGRKVQNNKLKYVVEEKGIRIFFHLEWVASIRAYYFITLKVATPTFQYAPQKRLKIGG